jgi:uncharacterized membrane protein
MINIFMRSPLPNTLAVMVLIALATTWAISLVLSLRSEPVYMDRGWFPKLLPTFTALGMPAALSILQTTGIAFVFSTIVFIALILNIVVPLIRLSGRTSNHLVDDWYRWSILVSTLGGLAVTIYITFIEVSGGTVMCGTLSSGCEPVQNSPYAILFSILPVGTFGLMGYIVILIGWLAWQFGPASMKIPALMTMWGLCMFGVMFSTYLTFLEPFVIGATCMWCICSAVLMMAILLATIAPAQEAFFPNDDE